MGFGLGGISDFVFGEDPKLETQAQSTLSKEQRKLMNEVLLPFLTELGITPTGEEPTFEGDRVAQLTNIEQQLLASIQGSLGSTNQLASDTQGALSRLLSGEPSDFQDFFQQTIENPAREAFSEETLPTISRAFAPSGFFGSERRELLQESGEEFEDTLTRERARTGFNTRESALDRMLQAAQASSSFQQGNANALSTLLGAAGVERDVEQQTLSAEFEDFMRTRVQRPRQQQDINNLLAALGLQTTENIGAGLPGSTGFVEQFLGAL